MSIPNTLVKFVDKEGTIKTFDISRIGNALSEAIEDVEGSRYNLPEIKAHHYAEIITERIYREFYDLDWILLEFVDQYLNYEHHERHRRMNEAFITERATFVLLETFKEVSGDRSLCAPEGLENFVAQEINSILDEPKYDRTLSRDLDGKDKADITDYLTEKILDMASEEIPPKILCPSQTYIQDTIENELKKMGEVELSEAYMIYREGRKKVREGELSELQFTSNGVHKDVVRETNKWNINHQCHTIFELNRWVEGDDNRDVNELIENAEGRFFSDLRKVAGRILDHIKDLKTIIIAGPSCSNKTMASVILEEELKKEGLNLKSLNVDDYFRELGEQPKDKYGDYDFEMPSSIDLELLNTHLSRLIDGHAVAKPRYDFEKGKRVGTERFEAREDEIILIDCLHGLYRRLTESVPQQKKFKIYIESMNMLRDVNGNYTKWSDVRLLKRMIRDVRNRGTSPKETLAHWPYVRKGELKHIIPYIYSTDAVVNSGIPYELPVLKTVISDRYPPSDFIDRLKDKERLAAYIRGRRTKELLRTVSSLDTKLVPDDSPLREFIGGASFHIPHND